MDEETSDAMNLDLNLGPSPDAGTLASDALNLDNWVDDPIVRISEAVRLRARQRRRWRQPQIPHELPTHSVELGELLRNSGNVSVLQSGEGSVAAEERAHEVPKTCENNNGFVVDEVSDKNGVIEKGSGNDGSFFDCNICFDLATEPVVTCCGHLFCWPCLYQWLHVHSEANECPVCKGDVSSKNLTPIYGRGSAGHKAEEDPSLEIPGRPHARRIESLRQTIRMNLNNFHLEEMIDRLGSRLDLARGLSPRETFDRTSEFINRILASRVQAEQNPVVPPDDMIDLTDSGTPSPGTGHGPRVSLLLRRSQLQSHRSSAHASISAVLANHTSDGMYVGRIQEQHQPIDDRDSFSSIAAMINSESQMDTAVEIDSMVSLATSSSRRRTNTSRGSDIDSGDSHPPRRRRLN